MGSTPPEGEARLRDADAADPPAAADAAAAAAAPGPGGVFAAGLLARGRKGLLRFGVALGLGLGLTVDEGAARLAAAGGGGGDVEDGLAVAAPLGGTNLRGGGGRDILVGTLIGRADSFIACLGKAGGHDSRRGGGEGGFPTPHRNKTCSV